MEEPIPPFYKMYCKRCGTRNDNNVSFCKKCGLQLDIKAEDPDMPITNGMSEHDIVPAKNKKGMICLISAISLFFILFLLFWCIGQNKKYLSKYDWAELCCEEFGISTDCMDNPIFTDVKKNNRYYDVVQTFGVACGNDAKLQEQFKGRTKVTRRFATLTSLKLLYNTVLQTDCTDDYLIDLAKNNGMNVSNSEYLTSDEAFVLINEVEALYFNYDEWWEDYSDVVYTEDTVIVDEVIEYIDDNYDAISISNNIDCNVGQKVVFLDAFGERIIAKEIERKDLGNEGTILYLTDTNTEEVIDSFEIKQAISFDFMDLYNYYFKHGLIIDASPELLFNDANKKMALGGYSIVKTNYDYNYDDEGFQLTISDGSDSVLDSDGHISTNHNKGSIKVESLSSGASFSIELPTNQSMDGVNASFKITNFSVHVACAHNKGKADYSIADVSFDLISDVGFKIPIKQSVDVPIIPDIPVAGILMFSFDINVGLSLEGKASLHTEVPFRFGYELSNNAFRLLHSERNCTMEFVASGKSSITFGPKISIGIITPRNIASVNCKCGASLEVKKSYEWGNFNTCFDVKKKSPTLEITVTPSKLIEKILPSNVKLSLVVLGDNHFSCFDRLNEELYKEESYHIEYLNDAFSITDSCTLSGHEKNVITQEDNHDILDLNNKYEYAVTEYATLYNDLSDLYGVISKSYEYNLLEYYENEYDEYYNPIEDITGVIGGIEVDLNADERLEFIVFRIACENRKYYLVTELYSIEDNKSKFMDSYEFELCGETSNYEVSICKKNNNMHIIIDSSQYYDWVVIGGKNSATILSFDDKCIINADTNDVGGTYSGYGDCSLQFAKFCRNYGLDNSADCNCFVSDDDITNIFNITIKTVLTEWESWDMPAALPLVLAVEDGSLESFPKKMDFFKNGVMVTFVDEDTLIGLYNQNDMSMNDNIVSDIELAMRTVFQPGDYHIYIEKSSFNMTEDYLKFVCYAYETETPMTVLIAREDNRIEINGEISGYCWSEIWY